MAMSVLKTLRGILGIETVPVSHAERIVSAIGGFAGILGILLVTNLFVSGNSAALIVGSMGASAVLVFGVPHGPYDPFQVEAGGNSFKLVRVKKAATWSGSNNNVYE